MTLPCTVKQLAWAAWRRGHDVVGETERKRFEAWWAKIEASQMRAVAS